MLLSLFFQITSTKLCVQVYESCLKVPSVLELSNLSAIVVSCPSIYRVMLGAGVLDVYSCWWAWTEAIWPGDVGSVSTWSGSGWSELVRHGLGGELVRWDVGPVGKWLGPVRMVR